MSLEINPLRPAQPFLSRLLINENATNHTYQVEIIKILFC